MAAQSCLKKLGWVRKKMQVFPRLCVVIAREELITDYCWLFIYEVIGGHVKDQ